MKVYEKLMIVQQELIAPKNQYNSFGKYNYRSCEDILEGLKPCLKKAKAIVQVSDDIVMVGERIYVKATATFTDAESGESISNTAFARESDDKKGMDASQVTGATSSYARKYALNGLFCIDDVKDADTRDNRQHEVEDQKKTEVVKSKKIDSKYITSIQNKAKADGVDEKKILDKCGISKMEDMTFDMYKMVTSNWSKEFKNG